MTRVLVTIAAIWTAPAVLLIVAVCITRAQDNARVRAVRREMRAEVLEAVRIDREFWAIVDERRADA